MRPDVHLTEWSTRRLHSVDHNSFFSVGEVIMAPVQKCTRNTKIAQFLQQLLIGKWKLVKPCLSLVLLLSRFLFFLFHCHINVCFFLQKLYCIISTFSWPFSSSALTNPHLLLSVSSFYPAFRTPFFGRPLPSLCLHLSFYSVIQQ